MKKRKTVLTALICPLMLTGIISTAFISMLDSNVLKVEASEITETAIAKIGTEGYESLEDAINAVQNNETIVVIKDFTYDTPITINNGKTFTIDFNDGSTQHTFRWYDMMGSQTDKNIFTIDDNSNVTVKNMRYLVGVGEKANRVFNVNSTATLTLADMICSSDDDIKDIPVRNNGGTVVIDGGDITTNAPGGANLLSPVVQNLNNGTTTITGNGTFTMKNINTGVAWLGNIVTMASSSTDADQENPCGTVIIENGTFNNGHIVDVNGKGTVIINDATFNTGNGPVIKTFLGGVKSNIIVNNITSSASIFAQVLNKLNTYIDFQNGNVKYLPTRFCVDSAGKPMDSISIANGKFGPKSGTTDIHDEIEGFLADGAVISALTDDHDGYTYKVEIPVTPADILPDNLLESFDNKWDNENGYSMLYVYNDKIWLHDISSPTTFVNDVSITTPLTKSGDNYLTICNGITYTFSMENGVLTSISVSGATSRFNGTYRAPHTHSYGDVSDSWDGDQVTLTTSCSCGDEQTQTFTGTYTKVSDATCTTKETGKYVVTIAEGIFAGTYESSVFETGNPLGHTYGTPTPSWSGNELTLTVECSCGDSQSDTFTGTYTKVSDATCTAKETGKYVVTIAEGIFAGTYESDVFGVGNPLGHTYGTVSATWDGNQVTLTTSCSCGDEQTQTFTGTYTKVSDATCTAKETGKYVVTISDGIYAGTYESDVFEVGNTLRHETTKVNGQSATCTEDGYKDAYYCADCGMYFENADGTGLIGDSTAYNSWKLNEGLLPRLLSAGAIVGICVGSFLFLLVIIYLLGYFFLYRKGKLDEKKIKVIYKFLPRGEKNFKYNDR
ncbi:MAG: hypothetical protein MJ221_03210 [Bacilli bacterium]|nr:hypothetical protein [Bacilli bacterium]